MQTTRTAHAAPNAYTIMGSKKPVEQVKLRTDLWEVYSYHLQHREIAPLYL